LIYTKKWYIILEVCLVNWQVSVKKKILREAEKLSPSVTETFWFLVHEIETLGPLRYNWKNFGKLSGRDDCYHCHIKAGRPTYVVCWEVRDKKVKIVEVYYVGTHEKAPY
jgi:mRNA-degrading endonuclease RelE of RelBE toxin-antitoxin system